MKETLQRNHPNGIGIGFTLFVAVGLVMILALSMGSSVWATPDQSPLSQTIALPTPTPQPSGVGIGVYASHQYGGTGSPITFWCRIVNNSGTNIASASAVATVNNANIVSTSVTQGTRTVSGNTVNWNVGSIANGVTAILTINSTVINGAYQASANCSVTYTPEGGTPVTQTPPPAVVNPQAPPPEVPEASTILLLGGGLAGLVGYARLRLRARK